MNKLLNGLLFTAWLVPVSYQVLAAPKAPPLSSKPEATRASKNAETRTVRLRIQGMRSKSCPVLVKTALSQLAGVKSMSASVEHKTVTVRYAPRQTSPEEIQSVIKTEAGFDSVIVDR